MITWEKKLEIIIGEFSSIDLQIKKTLVKYL